MDTNLRSIGYEFGPSKYTPKVGYSGLRAIISSQPTERFFDVKSLHLPTFDGRYYHQTQVSRHELSPQETFQVCIGELRLESSKGEVLHAFSFGGTLQVKVEGNDLLCEFTTNAPILTFSGDPVSAGGLIVDEIKDFLAEKQVRLSGHEDELYTRLARYDPYQLFLACLVSLQKRADSIPVSLRRENFHKVISEIHRVIQTVQHSDGWDGRSPSLEDLISS